MASSPNPPGADAPETSVPIDLREPEELQLEHLQVPAGWEPVAAVANTVLSELDDLVGHVVDRVEGEVEAYARGMVPRSDLEASVRRNLEVALVGLAERRPPTAAELDVRREAGVRRAHQGMPIDALIAAYHVGYREMWHTLVARVPPDEPETATQLLTAATTVWRWTHAVTDAIATTYAATIRTLEAREVGARQRFVELLAAGDLDGAEATSLAISLGFDPVEDVRATVVRGATDDLHAVQLQRELDDLAGRHAVVARGLVVVVISQGGDADEVVAACRRLEPIAALATGHGRRGLRGARASLVDAEQTLWITPDGHTQHFDDAWLWATLADADERLGDLLEPGTRVARDHPHLAEAVRALAEAGFSVTQAARRLGLHANTVSYRLERWQELTGWDPRHLDGLVRSLAAARRAP